MSVLRSSEVLLLQNFLGLLGGIHRALVIAYIFIVALSFVVKTKGHPLISFINEGNGRPLGYTPLLVKYRAQRDRIPRSSEAPVLPPPHILSVPRPKTERPRGGPGVYAAAAISSVGILSGEYLLIKQALAAFEPSPVGRVINSRWGFRGPR